MWQWYIHAPGPTPLPAMTWNPKEEPGLRSLLSMVGVGFVRPGEHPGAVVRPAVPVQVEGVGACCRG